MGRQGRAAAAREPGGPRAAGPPVPVKRMDAPLIGRTLGHFQVTGAIGAGGMGVVYKATDLRLGGRWPSRCCPPSWPGTRNGGRRLLTEARAASALNHPHIVTVHEIDSADGTDFIAMEYVEGRPLDRVIGKEGLPAGEALAYGAQIAEALAAAHAQGVVHRDLKPANVIVTPQGQVKVVDFGLAKLLPREPLARRPPRRRPGYGPPRAALRGRSPTCLPSRRRGGRSTSEATSSRSESSSTRWSPAGAPSRATAWPRS